MTREEYKSLNDKQLSECYAFELRIIFENKSEDGMRGSPKRRHDARTELARRAGDGDRKAIDQLGILGCCLHGYPDQGEGCTVCGGAPAIVCPMAEEEI